MTRLIRFVMVILCITSLISLNACKKNNAPPGGGGGGGGGGQGTGLSIWYPATVTITTSSNPFPTVNTYVYDKDHNLIKFGNEDVTNREVSVHGVNRNVITTSNLSTRSYAFSNANSITTSVSIYDGLPTQVDVTDFDKSRSSGVTSSRVIGPWNFIYGEGGLLLKEITALGGGQNNNYSYDDKKNLKMVDIVPLTGPRFPNVTNNIKVTALDDHPSPFVWVKGYRFASWPQAYPQDYALAYCINNPTQIVCELWDATKNAMVPYQKDDFKYTYNENTYPEKIVQTTTYIASNGTTTSSSITYNYTYKQ